MGIETEDGATMSDEDRMAAEWAAALAETKDVDDTSGPSAGRGPAPAFGTRLVSRRSGVAGVG